ncbi:MAG: ABC transporter permease, partial [Chloroflexota bacterium]
MTENTAKDSQAMTKAAKRWRRSRMYNGTNYGLISVISPLLFLLLWELTIRAGLLDIRFFPPPTQIVRVLREMLLSGE